MQYGLSQILGRISAVPNLRVATVSDDSAMHSAHQYIEFLARLRAAR